VAPSTDQLIARLAAGVLPVHRLRPPLLRAFFFLAAVAAIGAAAMPLYADFDLFTQHLEDGRSLLELIGTLLTGIAAVIAAFELSVPDRSSAWAWLPIPPLILWLASSGYNCWQDWILYGNGAWHFGESSDCFVTIVGFSIPMGVALIYFLARAKPLAPVPVAAMGGLGVAGLAAFFLEFNHPVDASFLDLAWHAAAVTLVIVCSSVLGGRRVKASAALDDL
jgi:hypothetical protein